MTGLKLLTLAAAASACAVRAQDCPLRWSGFYQSTLQQQGINFIFTNNVTLINHAHAQGMSVLYDLMYTLFINRPFINGSYAGITLNPQYQSALGNVWNTTLQGLVAQGLVFGAWLGDELCWNGIMHAELAAAAAAVKSLWPDGVRTPRRSWAADARAPRAFDTLQVVYYNEAVPVITNDVDLWGEQVGFSSVPSGIDWFSIDYYRLDNTSWLYPRYVLYPQYIRPLLPAGACLLVVPGAYGSAHNPSFSLAQYEAFMVQQAYAYFDWAVSDASLTGMNPWYWSPYVPSPPQPWYYEVATSDMPSVRAAWADVGQAIVNGSAEQRRGTLRSVDAAAVLPADELTRLYALTHEIQRAPHAFVPPRPSRF